MKNITLNDYIVSFDNDKIKITYKNIDITDRVNADADVSNFISSVVNTIIKCGNVLEKDKEVINEIWNDINHLKQSL